MVTESQNPMGTDGFEFVEYAAPDPNSLRGFFERLGFAEVGRHKSRDVTLHRQGDVTFLVNGDPSGFAASFAAEHGPCACSMGFRVRDAQTALDRAAALEATVAADDHTVNFPAIGGIGGSRIYLIDRYDGFDAYDDFEIDSHARDRMGRANAGLTYLDHLTHNVFWGNMDKWAGFYERLFNFKEVRYFDIEGKLTGLISRAMTSPCGKIRIPINESEDRKSQINEYLEEYNGEGIQHIALGSSDIYSTVDRLKQNGVDFQDTPDTYYDKIDDRVPNHGEPVAEMRQRDILIDGGAEQGGGLLLQIFTKNAIGPIFFEIIQRKGNEGFGEGNFKALFESIEEDQIKRGYLDPADAKVADSR